MHLTRNEMIDKVSNVFNSQYRVSMNKRFIFSFDADPLKAEQIYDLNLIARNLDSQMLKDTVFSIDMSSELFDTYISRLLYVAGEWESLCHYNLLADFSFENCKFYCIYTETLTKITYFFNNMVLRMQVDEQKIAIKLEKIISEEKEF